MKSSVVVILSAVTGALLAASPAAAASTLDHWTCAKAQMREPRGNYRVTLGSPVGPQSCIVKRPAKTVCVGTTGSTVTPEIPGASESPGAGSLLCYQLKCRRRVGTQQQLQDAFGMHTVGLGVPRWLCTPAANPSAGPTTTTMPGESTTTVPGNSTTTTTVGNTACRFENGQCTGSCGAGSSCRAAAGTASCACRSVSCGNADIPQCDGACPSPDEACVITGTSCGCISIPR
jgi:hypothetical protein